MKKRTIISALTIFTIFFSSCTQRVPDVNEVQDSTEVPVFEQYFGYCSKKRIKIKECYKGFIIIEVDSIEYLAKGNGGIIRISK